MNVNTVSLSGNLVDDPEIRFTKNDVAVTEFRLSHSRRHLKEDGTWSNSERGFIDVRSWRSLAETVASTLHKGSAVRVDGALIHNEWTAADGTHHQTYSIDAHDVRPPLVAAVSSSRDGI